MRAGGADRFAAARAVADAVLYEGYVLYPYRASAGKNQLRWQFGVLTPRAFSEADGSERWSMRTECLLDAGPDAGLGSASAAFRSSTARWRTLRFAPVGRLEVDDQVYVDWDEAVDRVHEWGHPYRRAGRRWVRGSLRSCSEAATPS